MAEKLIIDWKEYNLITEKLAIQIHQSGYKPDMLIGIMRGGAPIIDVLSRIFKLKCAYLAVESYSGKGIEDQQGELVFSREMSSTVQDMKGNILLCDDLSDTGVTLNKSIDGPIRSGQQVYAEKSSLIIRGNISAGAEVASANDVHIYGACHGKILAGVTGNVAARIYLKSGFPELVSIAGITLHSEDIKPISQDTMFMITNGQLSQHLL